MCGEDIEPHQPLPQYESSSSLAIDDTDGPIVGERIEHYSPGEAAVALNTWRSFRTLPCEFSERSVPWRATAVDLLPAGDDTWAFVVESLDGPKGYTYEYVSRKDDELIKLAVSIRDQDPAYVNDVIARAMAKASIR